MRNLEVDEIWSVRVWTVGGLVFGLLLGLLLLTTVGRTFAVVGAPLTFALSACLMARQHNWTVRRSRQRREV